VRRFAAEGKTLAGSALMNDGVVPPCEKEFDSAVIIIERVGGR